MPQDFTSPASCNPYDNPLTWAISFSQLYWCGNWGTAGLSNWPRNSANELWRLDSTWGNLIPGPRLSDSTLKLFSCVLSPELDFQLHEGRSHKLVICSLYSTYSLDIVVGNHRLFIESVGKWANKWMHEFYVKGWWKKVAYRSLSKRVTDQKNILVFKDHRKSSRMQIFHSTSAVVKILA